MPAVERCLRQLPGLQTVKVMYPSGQAWIGFTDEIDLHPAIEALQRLGYTVRVVSQGEGPPVPLSVSIAGHAKRLGAFLVHLSAQLVTAKSAANGGRLASEPPDSKSPSRVRQTTEAAIREQAASPANVTRA